MHEENVIDEQYDKEGLDTLRIISATDQFNDWMYQTIKPFLKGNILEIGSGIGNITDHVIKDKFMVTASDLRKSYCKVLKDRLGDSPYLNEIRVIDIVQPDFDTLYQDLFEKFDSLFALNTVEHVFDDKQAISNCAKLLKKDGHLIILVPAYPVLFNRFDKELGHWRRYTKTSLESVFISSGLNISRTQYFNFIGIFGWWFSGNLLNKKIIPEWQMKLFNKLVPIFKLIDKLLMRKVGLSLITFGKK